MTSPVVVIGLDWDGFDLQRADLDILFELTEGLDDLPQTRGSDDVIPFRSGRLPQDRIADHRPVVATGWVTRPSASVASAYRAYVDSLKAKLDPTGPPHILVATLEDGSKRWINAVARDLIGGPALGSDFRPFSIAWDALDPYWYGTNAVIALDSGLFLDAGLTLDQDATIVITPTTVAYDYTFTAHGTTDITGVVVEIDGPSVSRPFIYNKSLDPVVGFGYATALIAGQTLVVDSGRRTATLGSVNARGGLTPTYPGNRHGEYIRVRPGENTIRIDGQPAEVRMSFKATYL
jgi:hypothetical protein